jgi:hypothetical protein
MAYEPEVFSSNETTPVDLQDLLNEMPNRLDHFVTDKGRYWFSPYRSVKEIIDKMAESLVREDKPKLYRKIEDIAKSVVNVSVSKTSEYQPLVFANCRTFFVRPGYDVAQDISVPDDEKMKLVVFLKQDVSAEDVENVLLRSEGARRLRPNTIVAVCPDTAKSLDDLLLFAAKFEASAQVAENLKEYYADQDVRSLQQKKLKRYSDENELHVKDGLLTTLSKVAFPTSGPSVKIISAQKAPSLVEQVERALNSASAGYKIRERIDFEDLVGYLKNSFNIDLIDDEKAVDFKYVFDDLFLAKPEGPFVARAQIEQALRQGIRTFDIAIKQDGKLYWKKVNTLESDEPQSISDRAEILPYRLAAREAVDAYRKQEGRKRTPEGHILETKFFVKVLEEEKPLAAVTSQPGYEKIVKENLIIKKETVIEEGFDLVLDKPYMTVKLGEKAWTKFTVEVVGEFNETVELQTAFGTATPSKGKPPFDGVWDLEAHDKPGTYKYAIVAKAGQISRSCELTVVVESEYIIIEVESLDFSMSGALFVEVRPYSISGFKIASDAFDKLGLEGKSRARVTMGDKITFEMAESNPSLCNFLLQRFDEFRERYGNLVQNFDYSGSIEVTKAHVLDQKSIANLQTLNKKAKFVIQVPR